ELALDIAAGDGVIGLYSLEADEVFEFGGAKSFGDPPGLPVGTADVADLPLKHEGIEGANSLLNGRDCVVCVNLVQVDVIGPQASEAALDRVHDVAARCAGVVA